MLRVLQTIKKKKENDIEIGLLTVGTKRLRGLPFSLV